MLALAMQDDGTCLLRRIAEEAFDAGNRRIIQGISFGRARQTQQRYRATLACAQAVRQPLPDQALGICEHAASRSTRTFWCVPPGPERPRVRIVDLIDRG